MKTKIKFICFILTISIGTLVTPKRASAQVPEPVSFQTFYDELSPYGFWVDNPEYGYVWIPNVDTGFSPYASNGYWVFTPEGWTWVSTYAWGWAPFHYGRWFMDPFYGPMWVPGYEWGPGWVTWRRSEGYYGWAPIGPGVGYDVAYGNNNDQWTFVDYNHFGGTDMNNHYVNNSNNTTIINNSTVVNNTYINSASNSTYNSGPNKAEVEKYTGRTINPMVIKESTKPGQQISNNQLTIYRPQIKKNSATGTNAKPAPAKVSNIKDVKPIKQKTTETQPQKGNQDIKPQPKQQQQTVKPAKQQSPQKQQTVKPAKKQPTQKQQTTVQQQKKGEQNKQDTLNQKQNPKRN